MQSVSFSFTEKIIIDSVLSMRAPLSPIDAEQSSEFRTEIWHVIESEILARIASILTSVFAAADTFAHLLVGLYKGTYLILRNVCHLSPATWNSAEVYGHFQRAASFSGLTIIGSLTGLICPDALRYYRYSPPAPLSSREDTNTLLGDDINTPEALRQLAHMVEGGQEQAPFNQLRQFWNQSSLENKHWFVHTFSRAGSENLRTVRVNLADTVYRPITRPLQERQIQWLSGQEIDQRINHVRDRANAFNRAFFSHATSKNALESILKSKKVEVRHERAFRGAFVSTQPEVGFGRCILAFKRNIERLSPLEHGFLAGQNTYWAGFSHDIPVTDTTLAYIILDGGTDRECRELQEQCQQWTGRLIDVISLRDVGDRLDTVQRLGMGIPTEWPGGDERTGQRILNTLRARVSVEVPPVQQHEVVQSQYAPRQQMRQPMMAFA